MNNFEVIGVDLGNRTVEAVSQWTYDNPIVFDSKTTKIKPLMTKCHEIEIDNKKYYVGEGKLDTEYRKVDKKNYITMLYTAISLATKSPNVKLVLGLPIGQIQEDASELINLVMSNSNKTVKINGNQMTINIQDIEVMPEGVCTKEDTYNGIIIDIGAGTTDCAIMSTVRGCRKIKKPISIPRGINTFYQEVADRLNEEYTRIGLDLDMEDVEEILDNGFFEYEGDKYKVDSYSLYTEFAEDIIGKLRAAKYPLKNKLVSITGGGSIAPYQAFRDIIGKNCELQDDPLIANARNYYEIGVNLFMR